MPQNIYLLAGRCFKETAQQTLLHNHAALSLATTAAEARGKMRRTMQRLYPVADGWTGFTIEADLLPLAQVQALLAEAQGDGA